MAKYIKLTKGQSVLVDDEDYLWLNQYHWYYGGNYAVRRKYLYILNGKQVSQTILMHRLIMDVLDNPDIKVDHINGNKLDNRRCNLRLCNDMENSWNSVGNAESSSKFKGVHYYKRYGNYQAYIQADGEFMHLGYYSKEEAAAMAYNKMAIKLHGEFAKLNNISCDNYEEYRIVKQEPTSKFKGVHWNKARRKWVANLRIKSGSSKDAVQYLGYYPKEIDAAKVYNIAVTYWFGKEELLNIIPDETQQTN